MLAVRRTALLAAVALLFSGLAVVGTATSAQATGTYNPPNGVRINNPLRSDQRWRIFDHIVRTIRSVPHGGLIRIASWNIRSDSAVQALVDAHRRGVSVRVIMDAGNDDPTRLPNPGFNWMRRQLRLHGNANRVPSHRSFAMLCHASCEGDHGMMHSKFFLFSRAGGKSRYIVMHGSANLTRTAAAAQWNNEFTVKSRPVYLFEMARFNQMVEDHYWANPMTYHSWSWLKLWNFPWAGRGSSGDPVLNQLNKVTCRATGGTGYNGHTLIRIAQTVLGDSRGVSIAKKLASLQRSGCRVRLVFTLLNTTARKTLDAAGIWRHIVAKDPDKDYVYDKYLHLKAMTIAGGYNGRTNVRMAWDGSHNWNSMSLRSDETFAQVHTANAFRAYSKFVDYYLYHPLPVRQPSSNARGIDPYAKVQID